MSLTEIIFWLFARLRPALWYQERLGRMLQAAVFALEDPDTLIWMAGRPQARCDFESKLIDGEHYLDLIIGLRVQEKLGLNSCPIDWPRARVHSARSLEGLALRLRRLIDRYNDVERLARLRAARIRREMEAAACRLETDHRPQPTHPRMLALLSLLHSPDFCGAGLRLAAARIRAPP